MSIVSEKPFCRHFHLFCWYYLFNIVISIQNGTKVTALEKSSRKDLIVWLVLFTDMFTSLLSRVPQRTECLLFISTSPNTLMRKSVKKPSLDSVSVFTLVTLGGRRGDFWFSLTKTPPEWWSITIFKVIHKDTQPPCSNKDQIKQSASCKNSICLQGFFAWGMETFFLKEKQRTFTKEFYHNLTSPWSSNFRLVYFVPVAFVHTELDFECQTL